MTTNAPAVRMITEEVAEEMRVSPNTLAWWRQQGTGPRWYKLGRRVFYDRADVEAWLNEQKNGR